MSGSLEPTPVELHLGDRLAALIDGELADEPRERVLAHLATCPGCKAEADAQRRVKSVCAGSAPPPPSDGLLARLQGLQGGGPGGEPDCVGPDGPRGPDSSARFNVHYAFPSGAGGHQGGLSSGGVFGSARGFRTHRPSEAERALRGRRLAFAAAGAVSLAAVALGGVATTGLSSTSGTTTASPVRVPAAGVERGDRRGEAVQSERAAGPRAEPTTHSSPLGGPGKQPVGAVSEVESRDRFAPLFGGTDGVAAYSSLAQLGAKSLLSPPLVLAAAYRGQSPTEDRAGSPRMGASPYAMPSANGSPAGPPPSAGFAEQSGVQLPTHTTAPPPRP